MGENIKMMHREVVAKKRVPVITTILLTLTVVLYLAEAIERSKFKEHVMGNVFNGTLAIITLLLIAKEIRSCFVSYKYAVIADKIIINSITSKEEKNLESIRMSDVLYIGDKSSIPRKYLFTLKTKKYLCNRIGVKSYYCICKNKNGIQKIKFQPSEKFVSKIIKSGGLKCDLKK